MPTADELALEKGMVVPYPHEQSMQLGLEMLNVFQADIVVTNTVGSGELFKAVLPMHKFGIGFCKTATHKKVVLDRLKAFAKLMNLVPLTGAPAKSDELINYEKNLQSQHKVAPKPSPVPRPVIPPPVPKVADPVPAPTPTVAAPTVAEPKLPTTKPATLAAFGGSLL